MRDGCPFKSYALYGTFIESTYAVPPSLLFLRRKALAFYRGNNFAGLDEELSEIVAARKLKVSAETSQGGTHAGIMV